MIHTLLRQGMLIQHQESNELFRILYVNAQSDYAIIINVNSNSGLPYMVDLDPLQKGLDSAEYTVSEDEIQFPTVDRLNKNQLNRMDRNWTIIRPLVEQVPICYNDTVRQAFIANTKGNGISESTVRRLLHNYWASGCNKIALAPRFDKRGRRPKSKVEKA